MTQVERHVADSTAYQDAHAQAFFNGTVAAGVSELRARFLAQVPAVRRILDAGLRLRPGRPRPL